MTDAILIFTFSPVQSFISEARRAADLFAGSRILYRLANAAATPLQGEGCTLIFPANPNPDHTPNKLVARVPFAQVETIAERAKKALLDEWLRIADGALKELSGYKPEPDETWDAIWNRQVNRVWEIYWAARVIENNDYHTAYKEAGRALDAVKRTRVFDAAEEDGPKDTLSGRRSALRVDGMDARKYWARIGEHLPPAKLRREGKERLDALGAIKRFGELGQESFPSVSTIASQDFLDDARKLLKDYQPLLKDLLGSHLNMPVRMDFDWPHDGDLLYLDTLTPQRLEDSYGIDPKRIDTQRLEKARDALRQIQKQVGYAPSPYYAIIQLDGDSMGEKIDQCKDAEQHRKFSGSLAEFAKQVRNIVEKHHGTLIYNGGDDVLALAPLSQALPLARALAQTFSERVKGCHASAGIAIAHHLYPLDVALTAARNAEHQAKGVRGEQPKDAVCVRVLKRSGEKPEARSKWDDLPKLQDVIELFKADLIASKLAYDVLRDAPVVTDLVSDARQATLRRLIKRHKTDKFNATDDLAECLQKWATALDEQLRKPNDETDDDKDKKPAQGYAELGKWLAIARFIAQGGGE